MALTVKQAEDALKKTAGNVMAAARALGVSRSTLYRKIGESAALQEVLTDTREELVDIAESALRKEVLGGNITAIIFTLKTQGKDRGYVERQEVSGKDGKPIEITTIEVIKTPKRDE
jgi:hypothetical protein